MVLKIKYQNIAIKSNNQNEECKDTKIWKYIIFRYLKSVTRKNILCLSFLAIYKMKNVYMFIYGEGR
jgi:hypothetical protein